MSSLGRPLRGHGCRTSWRGDLESVYVSSLPESQAGTILPPIWKGVHMKAELISNSTVRRKLLAVNKLVKNGALNVEQAFTLRMCVMSKQRNISPILIREPGFPSVCKSIWPGGQGTGRVMAVNYAGL
jgi:hypothetical protein